jgi:hypothetical protein
MKKQFFVGIMLFALIYPALISEVAKAKDNLIARTTETNLAQKPTRRRLNLKNWFKRSKNRQNTKKRSLARLNIGRMIPQRFKVRRAKPGQTVKKRGLVRLNFGRMIPQKFKLKRVKKQQVSAPAS